MAGITAAIIGAGVLGASASIYASSKQSSAANAATQAQLGMFNTARSGEQPFIQAGQDVLPTLKSLLTPGPSQTDTLKQLPGFQFASDWGKRAVENTGSTLGLGGNTLVEGTKFAEGLASENWGQLVSQLQGLVNTGAQSAGGVGNQAVATGQQIGGNIIGAGNAQAGAATSVGANLGNAFTTAALLQKLGAPKGAWDNSTARTPY